MQTLALVSQ